LTLISPCESYTERYSRRKERPNGKGKSNQLFGSDHVYRRAIDAQGVPPYGDPEHGPRAMAWVDDLKLSSKLNPHNSYLQNLDAPLKRYILIIWHRKPITVPRVQLRETRVPCIPFNTPVTIYTPTDAEVLGITEGRREGPAIYRIRRGEAATLFPTKGF
jgi:hypothetical protein